MVPWNGARTKVFSINPLGRIETSRLTRTGPNQAFHPASPHTPREEAGPGEIEPTGHCGSLAKGAGRDGEAEGGGFSTLR